MQMTKDDNKEEEKGRQSAAGELRDRHRDPLYINVAGGGSDIFFSLLLTYFLF